MRDGQNGNIGQHEQPTILQPSLLQDIEQYIVGKQRLEEPGIAYEFCSDSIESQFPEQSDV